MPRKTLLTESEVRRFLKLANMSSVGDKRIQEVSMYDDDEPKKDVAGKQKDEYGNLSEEEEEEMVDMEMGGMEDEPMDDMGDEEGEMVDMEMGGEEMGAEGGEGKMVAVDDFMSALEDALEDALGEPVGVDMDAGDEEEVEMDAEMEMDPEGGEEVEMEMGAEEEEELPGMRDGMYENTDAVVNEVVRRIASRLVKDKKQDDIANQLAERIFDRLTK